MKLFEQYQFQPFVKETLQKLNFQSHEQKFKNQSFHLFINIEM